MGGYTLWSPAPPSSIHINNPMPSIFIWVLTHKDLDKLFNSSSPQVNFPIFLDDEIKDCSKSDWLVKVVVLVQTTWFVMNCIERLVIKLPLSELEVMTLAYAALSGLIFALWWNKPTDVRFPTKVHLLDEGLVEKWANVPALHTIFFALKYLLLNIDFLSRTICGPDCSKDQCGIKSSVGCMQFYGSPFRCSPRIMEYYWQGFMKFLHTPIESQHFSVQS